MSSMLEQAIVDANALREVAIKTAESNLIEKYSGQIMYVENRGAVSRAADQIEDIKLIIEM